MKIRVYLVFLLVLFVVYTQRSFCSQYVVNSNNNISNNNYNSKSNCKLPIKIPANSINSSISTVISNSAREKESMQLKQSEKNTAFFDKFLNSAKMYPNLLIAIQDIPQHQAISLGKNIEKLSNVSLHFLETLEKNTKNSLMYKIHSIKSGNKHDIFTEYEVNNLLERGNARTSIQKGEIILKRNIEFLATVHKNSSIIIQFKKNNVKIELPGIALEDGCEGQIIKVTNRTTNKTLLGRVEGGYVNVAYSK